eukprot:TRINITY_DN1432_c0_g2_i1.p5 TRINITY_DN1432_c0_g2~~TRINITY_DN1432_c0_g2_i1.p5  ORF type:complete len:125 (+),score=2.66 TRINITY_DN1432_c0_g2_i1:918-1292(+)
MTSIRSQWVEERLRVLGLVSQLTEARQQNMRDERWTVHGNAQVVNEQVCCERQKSLMIAWLLAEHIYKPLAKHSLDSCILAKQPVSLLPGKQNLYEEPFVDFKRKTIKDCGDGEHGIVDTIRIL